MNDYDNSFEEENQDYESLLEEEYGDFDYDDYYDEPACKKCKTDESYEFVAINPVIITSVPMLQEIATVSIAASLWNHVNVPKNLSSVDVRCTKTTVEWRNLCTDVYSLINELHIPNAFSERIDKIVRKMAVEITNWVSYHYQQLFLQYGSDKLVYNLVYHIVWFPNGTIDCVQTARSMMTSLRLSEVEKLKFLCIYCLEEEIKEMSPLLFLNNLLDYVAFDKHPLIYYWYCYFKDEMHKVVAISNRSNLSMETYMFQHNNVDNWPAKEYFFDCLSREEQVKQAIWLIDMYRAVYQKAVLMKLDESQRLHVYMERAVQILKNYSHPRTSSKLILSTWFEARHLISAPQFFSIFRQFSQDEVSDTVLSDIWTSASEESRRFAVNCNSYEIVSNMLINWKRRVESDFIFDLLRDASVSTKSKIAAEEFFAKYCEDLFTRSEFEKLERLLKFFLPNDEECSSFKLDLVSRNFFIYYCENLLRNSELEKLERLLEFFLPNVEECSSFKRNLMSKSSFINCCENLLSKTELDKLERLLEFFLPNVEECSSFKRSLTSKSSFINCCENLSNETKLDELERLLEFFLPNVEECSSFKLSLVSRTSFVNHCESLLTENKLEHFDQVLEFFLPNAQECLSYKRNLVTQSFFNTLCEKLLKHDDLQRLDRLLLVLLPDAQERVSYKLNLVKNSNNFKNTCLGFYSSGNTNAFNSYLSQRVESTDAVIEYKRYLLMSPEGVKKCVDLMDLRDVIPVIIENSLPDSNEVIQFKKNMIFSPPAISKLRDLLLKNCLNAVQSYINGYLTSTEDKRALKKEVMGDFMETIRAILRSHNESYLNTVMLWRFGTENVVQNIRIKFKNFDIVFLRWLKDCIFEKYDVYLTKCLFKYAINIELVALGRFLNWYFQSPAKVKEYKLKIIRSYKNIDIFTTLLRGTRGNIYLKSTLRWLFQNDAEEIALFKKTHWHTKICNLI